MKLNLPTPVGVILFFACFCLLWVGLPLGWLDGLLKHQRVLAFVIAFADGAIGCMFAYDVFISKKTIDAAKEAQKYTTPSQSGASTPASRARGYFLWLLFGGVLQCIFTLLRIGDL